MVVKPVKLHARQLSDLIERVREYPAIFDQNHPDHSVREKIDMIWVDIVKAMKLETFCTGQILLFYCSLYKHKRNTEVLS